MSLVVEDLSGRSQSSSLVVLVLQIVVILVCSGEEFGVFLHHRLSRCPINCAHGLVSAPLLSHQGSKAQLLADIYKKAMHTEHCLCCYKFT